MDESDHHLCILCREIFTGLDAYVAHRSKGCKPNNQEDYFNNEKSQQTSSQPFEALEMGFPTATHALASEAKFMENIGLYPSLTIPKVKFSSPYQDRTTEGPELLMWSDTSVETRDLPSKINLHQKSQQQSLLSFLSKTKSVPSGNEMVSLNAPFTLDESYSDSPSNQRCRLWHPESDQENNISSELWNDILSSAAEVAGDIYLGDETPNPNDPTLIEEAFVSPSKAAQNSNSLGTCGMFIRTGSPVYRVSEANCCIYCSRDST